MGKKVQFIGISRIWYTNVVSEEVTAAKLKTLLTTAHEVKNSHTGTWGYEESDPETTEYVNELTGQTYYIDVNKGGIPTVKWTMGEYSFEEKRDLQGGVAIDATGAEATGDDGTAVGWKRTKMVNIIQKAVIFQTKTGNYGIFTNAQITGKVDTQEKALGVGVSAMALENGEIASEYWFAQEAVETTGD